MRVRFWGTRGSLPVSLTAADVRRRIVEALSAAKDRKLSTAAEIERFADELPFSVTGTYGGNSPCTEIDIGTGEYIVCDMGTGLRSFGQAASSKGPATYHAFMSHLHWDHIMGFPFFTPAYVPGNRIVIYGCHSELEEAFRRQHGTPSFPVEFSELAATIEFVRLEPEKRAHVAGLAVTPKRQKHSGGSYGYRFEHGGRTVVYSTDSEHKQDDPSETREFVEFFRGADLVIFDAMYSLADAVSVKEDWGHSSNVVGVELCHLAGAKHLCLFHHEPVNTDAQIEALLRDTVRYEEISRRAERLKVTSAYDGLEINL